MLEVELLPQSELVAKRSPASALHPKLFAEFISKHKEAATAAQAAGTLITEQGIFSPTQVGYRNWTFGCQELEYRYCPKYLVGTVNKISLTVINRDPTILIKAECTAVEEGQPARFVVERLWGKDLIDLPAPDSTTVVALRVSQNGRYITGALPTEITFGQNETSKVIEFQTVDDGAFGENGSVTIELLSDATSGAVNLQGKYTTWENWRDHTPDGGRSDRATVTITDNDNKPGVSIGPALGNEGDSGSSAWTFVVRLARATDKPVTVNYATSDDTATAGQDYTAVNNGSVTILAGETTAELDVSVTGDEIDEHNEIFNVTISLPSTTTAAAITGGHNATALGLIVDDDPAVITVAPKADMVKEGEEAVFVLTRAGVIDNPLPIQVRLRAPGRVETLDARFERGAATAEITVATDDNNLVDYPSVRDYTIEVFGDGESLERDDRIFTPGDPATATVKVTDDEELINVTVYPVKAVVSPIERTEYKFKRDGDISQPLTIQLAYFRDNPGDNTDLTYWSQGTFEAGQDELLWNHFTFDPGEITPQQAASIFPIMLTYVVFGDGGLYGLNRIYQGGDPNTATVTVQYEGFVRALVVGAEAPLQVSVGQTVSIPLTVTNTGSFDSETPITITSTHYSRDPAVKGTNEPRMTCRIDGPIVAGESASCEVSFLVQEKDLNPRNEAEIELDVIASDGRTASNAFRIYMRVRNGVSVGFTETAKLSVTEPGFGEPNAKANLTVTRVGRSDKEVQVAYTLEPSPSRNRPYPPVEGLDYADNSTTTGVITFGENETEKTITIDILGDRIDEAKEEFRVTLVPPEGVLVEEDKNYRTVVIDDATPPPGVSYRPKASLQLVSADPTPESAGSVDFAVVLDRVWGKDARFEVELDAHDNLTATPAFSRLGQAGDFEAPNGLIYAIIPAGQTRFEFSLTLYDDDVREDDETFQMLLTSPYDDSLRTIDTSNNKALATIADDDRVPPTEVVLSLSHNGSALESVPEGSTQQDITVTATFPQIRWPGDASNAPLRPADPRDVDTTVRVRFDPNSGAMHAAGLDDFEPLKVEDDQGAFGAVEAFDIVIPAGQTSGTTTLRFRTVKDDVDEEDETVTLLGSELVASDSADSLPVRSASFTIIDDDTTGITISPAKLAAGTGISMKEGGTSTYSLVLDSEPTDTVTVTVAGRQGDLISLTPETLTFTPSDWSTAKAISVVSLDDGTDTSFTNAVISHQVSGGDYGSVTVREIWVQIENTTQAYIYLDDAQASESDGHLEFTVSVRPILRTVPVVVRYATVDGTAVAGLDYTREVETGQTYKILTIPASRSSGAIRIPIVDDQVYESAGETFTLQLTNHNNKANLDGDATSLTATGAITDDDPKPVVSVAGPAGEVSYVSENAKDPVTFTLTLVGQSAGDVTVNYATGEAGLLDLFTARQGLTGATENEDYAGVSGTFTFTSGQTTKTVTVQVTNDDVSEETEFFGFKISAPQGADLRGQRSEDGADVGLLDDDQRGAAIDPISISLDEPVAGETAVAGAYTVKLNSKPTDTVTVTIGGSAPAVSLSGGTLTNNQLTFTTTNWNTAQTITITPVKDDNGVGETVTLTHTLSGGGYAGIAADSVTVNLTDSDTRNLVLSKQSLTVTEGDAIGDRYTVKLATQPSDTVTVTISGHDSADQTLSGTTLTNNRLTFTTTNWGTAQTITVKAGDDNNTGNESVTLAHTASGGDYVTVTKDLPVTITDDDTADIVLSETDLTVTEGDAAGSTYTVKLATQPSDTVTVSITGQASTDLSLDKTTLTFTVDNWDAAQTVTVKAGQDNDGANDTATLTHTASGGDYAGITADLPVTITDDDTADIVLSETDLTVTEGDAAGSTYTVKLATQPSGSVTVSITGHDGTDLSLDKTTLTFTVDNWDAAQTVTVKAGQDNDGANDTATLTHTASGGDYAGITADLPVTVTDDDTADIVLSETDLTVTEGDAAGSTYTVKLATQPSGSVIVTISGHDGTDLTLDKTSLSFTVDNWDVAQTVTVKAGQDNDGANDTATLTHTASGGDYAGITADLPVTVTDDDTANIVLSETDLTVTEGDAAGSTYTVKLATQPSGSVTVSITGQASTDLSLDKTSLSFTVDNWNVAQTVTVKAGQDNDGANDTATLTHTASGGDYVTVTKDLPVTVTDDDTADIVLSETDLTVTEGDAAGSTYTVKLATQPSDTVIVTISGHGGTDLSLDKTSLSFTVDNWDVAQTVTVKAGEDANADDESESLTHTASGGDYAGITADLPVTVTDDDPQVTVMFGADAYTVPEGGTQSVTVTLNADPERTVVIPLRATDQGSASSSDYSVPTSVTFDTGELLKTITFTAAADMEDDDGESVLLTFGTLPSGVSEGTPATTTVSITDDDSAGVSVSKALLPIDEGGSGTYTIVLDSQPIADVTVTINDPSDNTDVTAEPDSLTFTSTDWNSPKTVTVSAAQDADAEDETATVTHTVTSTDSSYNGASANSVSVTVTDDAPAGVTVVFGQAAYRVIEGGGVTVTVTLNEDPERTVEIPLEATNQGGASDSDYSGVPESVTFNSGETVKSFTLTAADDNLTEPGESVKIAFGILPSTPVPVTAGAPAETTVSINGKSGQDTPTPPTVHFASATYSVAEGNTVTVTVELSKAPGSDVVIPLRATEQGTATLADHSAVPLDLTFAAADTQRTFTFEALQDTEDDDDESVLLGFSALPVGITATTGEASQATVTITDDDDPQVTVMFGADAYTVPEGATQSVTVTLNADPERTVVIPLRTTDQGSASSSDYSVPTSVTFDTGELLKTIAFTAAADMEDDDGESVLLSFGTLPSGVSEGTPAEATVSITDDCRDVDIWCATVEFGATVHWEGRYDLYTAEVDNREFSHNGADYQLFGITVPQNGHDSGDDNHVVLPFGIPERTHLLIDFLNLSGTSDQVFDPPNNDWLDWTLHVSTVSDGEKLTATLRFSEAMKLAGAWWRWSGGDIDDLRRAWKEGQPYKLRIVEDPRSERTPQPLNPPLYLRVEEEVNTTQTRLRWLTPQTRNDRVPPVDSYKIQWKQSSGNWDTAIDVSETTRGPSSQRPVSHFLDGLTPGVEYNIRVIATDSAGDSEPSNEVTYTKPASGQYALSNTPAEGEPRIDGIPELGQTLLADTTAIADIDGLENVVFQYQWLADYADIAGSTGASYTVVSGDVGKAIRVRVAFADDGDNEETLTSAPTVVTAAGLQLQSATVDGVTLTLTYNEVLDTGATLGTTVFAVNVNGSPRSLSGVGVGGSNVLLLLSSAVEAGDTVTVDYTAPDGPDFIRDTLGRKAASFSGQAVTNDAASAPLTARGHDAPSSHNGQDAFTFELRFSADPKPDFSYTTVRDHAFTVTGGSVTYVRRLEPGKNVRWEITVTPGSSADVAIDLNATTDCSAQGAICTEDGGKLSGGLLLVVPGLNTPATGAPDITGAAQVGETLTADTTGISDDDGLDNAAFAYQWFAAAAEINGATASSYTLLTADEGKAITVRVTFTDDAGNDEELTSPATGAVAAAVVRPPLTASAHEVPSSHDGSAAFTFELRFSEELPLSYVTLRDHAFTVDGGTVKKAERITKGSNARWRITVEPDGDGRVIITLPVPEGCDAQGAICTEDGRPMSNRVELTVNGPGQ